MIRNNQFIGQRKRVVRYTLEEWRNPEFRIAALIDARDAAKALRGEVVIKVKNGRNLETMARIRYVEGSNGYRIDQRAWTDDGRRF